MQIKTFGTRNTVKKTIFSAWLLGFLFITPAYARHSGSINFERLSPEQGLSQNTVQCILQDRYGFMWFGTQDGLNKYDGYKFTVYRHDPDNSASLANNYVLSMFEDTRGNLWIGTRGDGLDKLDRKTETFIHHKNQPGNPKSISNNNIWSICEASQGGLWIGTLGGGLNKFDQKSGTFTHYRNNPDDPKSISSDSVRLVYEDTRGDLWIGTLDGGLNKFDQKTGTFVRYRNQPDNPSSLSNDEAISIYEDTAGNLWIATRGGGLNKLDRKTGAFTHYQHQPGNPKSISSDVLTSIYEDTRGNLWIGTLGDGLNKFDPKTGVFSRYRNQPDNLSSLSNDVIYSVYEDKGGNLWVGTLGGGISKFNRKAEAFNHYRKQVGNPNSLSNSKILSVHEDASGNLWIGTHGGGLNKFDPETEVFTHYQNQPDNPHSISDNHVYCIYEDSLGDMWFGTHGGGLNSFDRETGFFTRYQNQVDDPRSLGNNNVFAIHEDALGDFWIGTYGGGLNKFNRKTGVFTRYRHQADNPKSISNDEILSMFEDSMGNLWIGTQGGGLNKFSRKTEDFTSYLNQADDSNSLSHNIVSSIFEDLQGSLWIGTLGGGLNKFSRKTETFTCYREKDGLPNDVIYGILEDQKGSLWLSTNKGLSKFNLKTQTFTNYDRRDGLQGNEYNYGAYHKDRAGRMYFGGVNGLNEFYANNIHENTYIPQVVITDFLLFNKPVEVAKTDIASDQFQLQQHINLTKEIILDYTDYIFAFEFSALNYSQSEKNQFAYKLEGFDKDWVETDYQHRRVTYTDIAHGEYTFRVKASNDDGHWNTQGASIRMTILPPPWKTWWAYSLYTLAALSLVFWFIQSQRKKVIQKQRELDREKQVSARLKQLDTLKNEFLANTSHELRTPLNGIIGIAESLFDGAGEWPLEKIRSNLGMIASSGKRLASLVNDILDFSNMQHRTLELARTPVDIYAIANVVLATSKILVGEKALKLVNDIASDIPSVYADENRLQQIMYNVIGNAIKFTETGTVTVSASIEGDKLEVRVHDTGIGIPEDKFESIFESFEQAEGSTARVYGGTGLGLTITKQLVVLHGGEIWLESTEGKGSTFYFTLPISHEMASGQKAEDQPVSKVQLLENIASAPIEVASRIKDVLPAEGSFNILIVDDDPVNLQVLENHLSLQNYKITQAPNGPEALRLIEGGQKFDLILLDIMMPKMSGYEVTEMLRESHAAHELPIIFLSAKNQVVDLITGFDAGGNDYLTKPISKAELLSRVETHLQLLDINRNLEQKVRDRTAEVVRQKEEIQLQAKQLAQTNLELEKLSIVASETDNAVTIMDAEGNIEWVNEAFVRFYKMTLEEYVEDKGRNIIEASPNPRIKIVINECISENKPVSYESYIKMKKGENMWAHTTLTPMLDKRGTLLKLISIDSDITELKEAQQKAISHAHKAGMADVAINTIHNVGNILNSVKTTIGLLPTIMNRSKINGFKEANSLLRKNIDTLDEFICNDPKGKRLMSYYLKIEKEIDEERLEMQQSIDRLRSKIHIIHDVIEAQRGYTEDIEFLVDEVDLAEIVEDVFKMNSDFIEKSHIRVEKEIADIPPIPLQKMKLLQIMINLITNAKDALEKTPKDKRTLRISTKEEGNDVLLKVVDTGCGIKPEDMSSIFNHGFTTKEDHQGFGLHSCANYMSEMGGRISASSDGQGKGAAITLKFKKDINS
ncbi:MAG: response regulator [Proteobacteria bacterium]|nr:response regulator [Pseudomonadota bacterium]